MKEVGVALIGHRFMGKAHSNAYRQVGPFMSPRLRPRMKVLCGRDARAVGQAAKELGWDVANGVWFLLAAPKGTPAPVLAYLHDAARAAIEEPAFREAMAGRGIDVDYRPGTQLRGDLWKEYKLHTEILNRIGMIKN